MPAFTIQAKVPDDILASLDEEAREQHTTRSAVVRLPVRGRVVAAPNRSQGRRRAGASSQLVLGGTRPVEIASAHSDGSTSAARRTPNAFITLR